MRALLVVNHQATTTSPRSREVLVHALRSEVEVEVAYTASRGHATTLAQQAATAGVEVVVAHGGDGTVNEVVNGLMPVGSGATGRPALAVVPGGSTNVFARALGLPRDWAEAAGVILEALRGPGDRDAGRASSRVTGRTIGRTIGLGRADERYFTFCAGIGIDAAVVRQVEQARLRKGRGSRAGNRGSRAGGWGTSTPALYMRATASQLLRDRERGRPAITLEPGPPEPSVDRLATVIVQNTAPWTYLGDRAIDPNPDASFDLGLDVLALRALRVPSAVRTFGQMLSQRRSPHGKQVLRWHDLTELTLHATRPLPFQVDGDYLGERQKVQLRAVPQALRVLC